MAMSEAQRQTCLAEMGIDCYFPRFRLPNAAPARSPVESQSLSHDDSPAPRAALPEDIEAKAPSRSGSSPVAEVLAGLGAEQTAPEVSSSVLAPGTENEPAKAPVGGAGKTLAATPSERPRFGFACVPASERLLVLCQLPDERRTATLTNDERTLLSRILRALSVELAVSEMNVEAFHWPLESTPVGNLRDLQEDEREAAGQALQGFLGRRLRHSRADHLLVLADSGHDYLFSSRQAAQPEAGQFGVFPEPVTGRPVQALITRSLQSMNGDRATKKQAWDEMQILLQALTT